MILRKKCRICNKEHFLKVNELDAIRWKTGSHIQVAMPYLTADERELLISGICGKCFDKMFGGGEE